MNIDVSTNVGPDRSLTCDINVDGRMVAVTFVDGEVTLAVLTADGEVTLTVPQALLAGGQPA